MNRIHRFDNFLNESGEQVNLLHMALALKAALNLAHWQTTSYAQHKALDKIYEEVGESLDALVESYIGKTGNRGVPEGSAIMLFNFDPENPEEFADMLISGMNIAAGHCLTEDDSELLAIIDDVRALLDQLKYLFTLDAQ